MKITLDIPDGILCGFFNAERILELLKADKEGRVAVLPCEVGGSMLNTIDIERPRIMKGLHFAVAYESVRGIIFYVPYDIFREYIDAGHVQPLHKLKEAQANDLPLCGHDPL